MTDMRNPLNKPPTSILADNSQTDWKAALVPVDISQTIREAALSLVFGEVPVHCPSCFSKGGVCDTCAALGVSYRDFDSVVVRKILPAKDHVPPHLRERLASMRSVVEDRYSCAPTAAALAEAERVVDQFSTAFGSDASKWEQVAMGATADGGVMFEVGDTFEVWVEPGGQLLARAGADSDEAFPISLDAILEHLRSL